MSHVHFISRVLRIALVIVRKELEYNPNTSNNILKGKPVRGWL